MNLQIFVLVASILPSVSIASLASAPVVFESGNWTVLRTVDAMTDKTSCTGIYNGDFQVQLTERELFIGIRGSLQAYKFRFDDNPASSLILADEIEKRLDTIIVRANFKKALGSNRLRVSASTYSSSLNFDFDLTGMVEAVENIKQGCQGEPLSGSDPDSGDSLLCGSKVISRLKERGVAADTIQFACGK